MNTVPVPCVGLALPALLFLKYKTRPDDPTALLGRLIGFTHRNEMPGLKSFKVLIAVVSGYRWAEILA
jgi:hypothetical protein